MVTLTYIECSGIFSSILFVLFDSLLFCGKLPNEWKTAHVVPAHKSGKKK